MPAVERHGWDFHRLRHSLNLRGLSQHHHRHTGDLVDVLLLQNLGILGRLVERLRKLRRALLRSAALAYRRSAPPCARECAPRGATSGRPPASSSPASAPEPPQRARRCVDPFFLHCSAPPPTPLSPLPGSAGRGSTGAEGRDRTHRAGHSSWAAGVALNKSHGLCHLAQVQSAMNLSQNGYGLNLSL